MKIITLGDDLLRKVTSSVENIDAETADFAEKMIETMIKGNGIGLAAPQVGDLRRMFVCQVPDKDPMVFINPEIIGTSDSQVMFEEGCLSIPQVYSEVKRPEVIAVQAWNEKGKIFKLEAGGILARVIQHEFDHLNGVLFIDHLSDFKRNKLVKLYNKKIRA